VLRTNLIPVIITRRSSPNDLECDLFALPAWHGGLGIQIPSKNADRELQSSQKVTSSLKDHILYQDREYGYDINYKTRPMSARTMKRGTKRKQTRSTNNCKTGFRRLWILHR